MGYSPWCHKESDTTERLTHTIQKDGEPELDLSPSPYPKAQESGELSISEGRRRFMTQVKKESKFAVPPPFCFIQALKRIGWHLSVLVRLSLLIQMLIFSRNSFTDTPRNDVYQLSGHPLGHLSWHIQFIIAVTIKIVTVFTLFFKYFLKFILIGG